jgi:hypothetical protein
MTYPYNFARSPRINHSLKDKIERAPFHDGALSTGKVGLHSKLYRFLFA